MDTADLVLLIVENSGKGHLQGRTLLQKIAYFINEIEDSGISFFPHYYGPYSEEVANTVDSLVATRLVQESPIVFGIASSPSSELKRYDYSLTKAGQKSFNLISNEEVATSKRIRKLVQKIGQSVGSDYHTLSMAAKTHHILKTQKRAMNSKEIAKVAKSFGWPMKPLQIKQVYNFLAELELVTLSKKG